MTEIEFSLNDIDIAAQRFVEQMGKSTIFAFYGPMGTGKTTFIRAVVHALGVKDEAVNSPTFSIVNEYESNKGLLYHFDFYRINTVQEAIDFGLYDYFDSGHICFLEWPDLIEELLPEDSVKIEIAEMSNGLRKIKF